MTKTALRKDIIDGLRVGFPIAMGYFAVAFSLGIIAVQAGLTAPLGFLSSFFTRASAGEYGTYTLVAIEAAYAEVVVMCLVVNLRYMLMSAALSQKIAPGTSWFHRLMMAFCITDEVFGVSLYGMFLAIIIPQARNDQHVLYAVMASFVLSGLFAVLPVVSQLSSGMRTVVLTILISAVAAWLKPIKVESDGKS